LAPTQPPIGSEVFPLAYRGWGVGLTNHLLLGLKLRMSGATPLLPLYALVTQCHLHLHLSKVREVNGNVTQGLFTDNYLLHGAESFLRN
jgi:hypothetical protein